METIKIYLSDLKMAKRIEVVHKLGKTDAYGVMPIAEIPVGDSEKFKNQKGKREFIVRLEV